MLKKSIPTVIESIPRYFTVSRVIFFLSLLFLLVFFPSFASAAANLTCSFSTSCADTAVLYLNNDTGGYSNAHAQLPTDVSYSNILCCGSLNTTLSSDACTDATTEQTFLRLYETTNTHVQVNNYSDIGINYTNYACIIPTRGSITCAYALNSCPEDYTCLASIASDNATFNNLTNAHVGPCEEYVTQICCSLEVPNDPPSVPILLSPPDNSQQTNRTPTFIWSASTDPDGDPITYTLNITCYALAGGSCPSGSDDRLINVSLINSTVLTQELDYFIDDRYYYNWTVLATDGMNDSAWAAPAFSLNISVLVDIALLTNKIDFSTMSIGQTKDTFTSDVDSGPFALRNNGNVEIEVNLSENSTLSLFTSQIAPSIYYQFKGDYATGEEGAFLLSDAITNYTNIPRSPTNLTLFKKFNHTDTIDEAEIDINLSIPLDEPAGYKESTIEFIGYYAGAA